MLCWIIPKVCSHGSELTHRSITVSNFIPMLIIKQAPCTKLIFVVLWTPKRKANQIITQFVQITLCFEGTSGAFCMCNKNLRKQVTQSADISPGFEKYFH